MELWILLRGRCSMRHLFFRASSRRPRGILGPLAFPFTVRSWHDTHSKYPPLGPVHKLAALWLPMQMSAMFFVAYSTLQTNTKYMPPRSNLLCWNYKGIPWIIAVQIPFSAPITQKLTDFAGASHFRWNSSLACDKYACTAKREQTWHLQPVHVQSSWFYITIFTAVSVLFRSCRVPHFFSRN